MLDKRKHKSTTTAHAQRHNCVTDWEGMSGG